MFSGFGRELPRPKASWAASSRRGASAPISQDDFSTPPAIGIHHPKLRKRAIAIGEKIGLYRDWPVSKGCIIPYVPVWVEAMVKRQG